MATRHQRVEPLVGTPLVGLMVYVFGHGLTVVPDRQSLSPRRCQRRHGEVRVSSSGTAVFFDSHNPHPCVGDRDARDGDRRVVRSRGLGNSGNRARDARVRVADFFDLVAARERAAPRIDFGPARGIGDDAADQGDRSPRRDARRGVGAARVGLPVGRHRGRCRGVQALDRQQHREATARRVDGERVPRAARDVDGLVNARLGVRRRADAQCGANLGPGVRLRILNRRGTEGRAVDRDKQDDRAAVGRRNAAGRARAGGPARAD
jgi:hypothetical protein